MRGTERRTWVRGAILIALCALSLALFFRVPITNGFTVVFGEEYDATIEVVLLEHWYAVVRGLEGWTSPNYFHPYNRGLGYNDGFFVSGLVYSVFRMFGADPFLANTFVYMVLKMVGFFGMYRLLRGVFACGFPMAALGAVLFVVSNNTLMQALHGQLMMLNLLPILAIQLIRLGRAVQVADGAAALRWGAAFGICYGAVALTGFYMAWFFGYLTLATLLVLPVVAGAERRRAMWRGARAMPYALAGVAVVAMLALIPLAWVYLPHFASGNAHRYAEAMQEMARPSGILNVGAGNVIWGRAIAAFYAWRHSAGGLAGEQISGFPPFLLLLAVAASVGHVTRRRDPLLMVIAVAAGATWLTTLRVGDHSLWRIPFTIVPGASALRALARYQIFLTLPLIVLAMTWLDTLRGGWVRRAPPLLVPLLTGALVLEEINRDPPVGVNRAVQLARIAAVPPIPRACRAFYIVYAAPPNIHEPWEWAYIDAAEDRGTAPQIDAMLLAALRRVPTINGYATFGPPDGLSGDTLAPDFPRAVRTYIADHRLAGICGYDSRVARRWRVPSVRQDASPDLPGPSIMPK